MSWKVSYASELSLGKWGRDKVWEAVGTVAVQSLWTVQAMLKELGVFILYFLCVRHVLGSGMNK